MKQLRDVDFYAPAKLNSVITVIIITTKKQKKSMFVMAESFNKVFFYFFHSPIKARGKYQVCLGLGGIIDPSVDEQESKLKVQDSLSESV